MTDLSSIVDLLVSLNLRNFTLNLLVAITASRSKRPRIPMAGLNQHSSSPQPGPGQFSENKRADRAPN